MGNLLPDGDHATALIACAFPFQGLFGWNGGPHPYTSDEGTTMSTLDWNTFRGNATGRAAAHGLW